MFLIPKTDMHAVSVKSGKFIIISYPHKVSVLSRHLRGHTYVTFAKAEEDGVSQRLRKTGFPTS